MFLHVYVFITIWITNLFCWTLDNIFYEKTITNSSVSTFAEVNTMNWKLHYVSITFQKWFNSGVGTKLSFLGYTLIYCRNLGKNKWIPWRILYFSFFIKQFKGRVGDLRRERDLTFVSRAKLKVWSIKRVFATEGDLHVPLHKEKKT